MLPLRCSDFPTSPEQLIEALREGCADYDVTIRNLVANGIWPLLDNLSIDLTGAQITRATSVPLITGKPATSLNVERLAIGASPLTFESIPLRIDLQAQKTRFGFGRNAAQQPLLQLTGAENGLITIDVERADLEVALKKLATEAAKKQGAEVKTAHLEFMNRGARSLHFRAEITAKVFIMTAKLTLTGQLDVDEQLNLRVHGLEAKGDGMVANLAAGYLQPRFEELEGRAIPLAAFSFAELKLHDVRLIGGNTLRLEARFRS